MVKHDRSKSMKYKASPDSLFLPLEVLGLSRGGH